VGAASISNAPMAATPTTLVTFIGFSLGIIGYHAGAVRLFRIAATQVASWVDDVNEG
jgi:hypothetical protein